MTLYKAASYVTFVYKYKYRETQPNHEKHMQTPDHKLVYTTITLNYTLVILVINAGTCRILIFSKNKAYSLKSD